MHWAWRWKALAKELRKVALQRKRFIRDGLKRLALLEDAVNKLQLAATQLEQEACDHADTRMAFAQFILKEYRHAGDEGYRGSLDEYLAEQVRLSPLIAELTRRLAKL